MANQPSTARVWQYSKTAGGLENHLQLKTAPLPTPKPDQHLIRVIAAALNPVDYKIAETPGIGSFAVPKPATPCLDIAGEIVVPATTSPLKKGQLVLGAAGGGVIAGGGLAEYAVAGADAIVEIPAGVSPVDAASLPVAGVTAYQALAPHLKEGDKVFFNGGSGGVGLMAIQIAKVLGCHITVSCSSRNVAFCKELGADAVIDYTESDIMSALKALDYKFDLVVDGVGNDHALYWKCDSYTNPGAKFIYVAFSPNVRNFRLLLTSGILPSFLGGQKRKLVALMAKTTAEDIKHIVDWVAAGKIKPCIDSQFPMDKAPDAFRKLRTSRARGKIIIDVAPWNG